MAIAHVDIDPTLPADSAGAIVSTHPFVSLTSEQRADHVRELQLFLNGAVPHVAPGTDHELWLLGVGERAPDGSPGLSASGDAVVLEKFGDWNLSKTQILLVSQHGRDAAQLNAHRQFAADVHAHRPLAGDEAGIQQLRELCLESTVYLLAVDGADRHIDAARVKATLSGLLADREAGPLFLGGLDLSGGFDYDLAVSATDIAEQEKYPVTRIAQLDAQNPQEAWCRRRIWEHVMVRTKGRAAARLVRQAILSNDDLGEFHHLFVPNLPSQSVAQPKRMISLLARAISKVPVPEWDRWQTNIIAGTRSSHPAPSQPTRSALPGVSPAGGPGFAGPGQTPGPRRKQGPGKGGTG